MEFGESLEAAAVRETMEETGIEMRVTRLVGFKNVVIRESGGRHHDVLFCYAGVAKGGKLKRVGWCCLSPLLCLERETDRLLAGARVP